MNDFSILIRIAVKGMIQNTFIYLLYKQLHLVLKLHSIMKKKLLAAILLPSLAIGGLLSLIALKSDPKAPDAATAGLTLPSGFNAAIVADNLGGVRHIAVTPENEIYAKLKGLEKGKGILLLHQNGGKADVKMSFGNFGGTGITVRSGYLY